MCCGSVQHIVVQFLSCPVGEAWGWVLVSGASFILDSEQWEDKFGVLLDIG